MRIINLNWPLFSFFFLAALNAKIQFCRTKGSQISKRKSFWNKKQIEVIIRTGTKMKVHKTKLSEITGRQFSNEKFPFLDVSGLWKLFKVGQVGKGAWSKFRIAPCLAGMRNYQLCRCDAHFLLFLRQAQCQSLAWSQGFARLKMRSWSVSRFPELRFLPENKMKTWFYNYS